jgi:hypothetical protein
VKLANFRFVSRLPYLENFSFTSGLPFWRILKPNWSIWQISDLFQGCHFFEFLSQIGEIGKLKIHFWVAILVNFKPY